MIDFWNEYHTDIVSWLALILTVVQWGQRVYKNRINLSVALENMDHECVGNRIECILVFSVINNSTAPINITRVMLQDESMWVPSRLRHAPVFIHNWPTFPESDIPRSERTFSTDFPVHLESRGAASIVAIFRRELDAKDFVEGEYLKIRFVTDKKDIDFELKCKICPRGRLAEYY